MHADADPSPDAAKRSSRLSTAGKIKLAGAVVAAILVLIIVLQNTETVTTRLFFISIDMPRVVLLVLMLGIGFVLGALFGHSLRKRAPGR